MKLLADIRVLGVPQAQGSIKAFMRPGAKFASLTSTNKNLKPWRQDVGLLAKSSMNQLKSELATGAVRVDIWFGFQRPKSRKKDRHKTTKPDLDKLERAVLDALTGICYQDDSQVTVLHAEKFYGDAESLIRVYELEGAE